MSEEAIVKEIITALRQCGCTVLRTGVTRARHSNCTPGTPDLFARRSTWARGQWTGLEVKGPKTPLSEAQERLVADGAIVVVRSVDEALEAVLKRD